VADLTDHGSLSLFARTIRGIEWCAAAEIEQRCGATIGEIRHREIRFQVDGLSEELRNLGGVDDVFLTCGTLNDVDHTRAALAVVAQRASEIKFLATIAPLRQLREIPARPKFDVVASFLGRRNYNRFEVEDTVAAVIRRQTGWTYTPQREIKTDRLDLSFRIHLSGQEAILGLRVMSQPLHRRTYKTESRTGTLHPPLAFALAMLSNLAANQNVVDPFCGVGTILIESTKLEPRICALGVDIDQDSTRKARRTAESAGSEIQFVVGDAGRLPIGDGRMDRVISNPPWGRAVEAEGSIRVDRSAFFEELRRISKPEARIILLFEPAPELQELIERSGFAVLLRTQVSLFGSWPEIYVLGNGSTLFPETGVGPALDKYWRRWPAIVEQTSRQ
jgi:tRNA (guanine6-N2)-methyltransferase